MNRVAIEAAKLVDESVKKLKATLAEQGKTLDDWLEEERIRIEETRRRTAERARKEKQEKEY